MSLSLARNIQLLCNGAVRHRSYSILQLSRIQSRALQQSLRANQKITLTVPASSLHTSCPRLQLCRGHSRTLQQDFLVYQKVALTDSASSFHTSSCRFQANGGTGFRAFMTKNAWIINIIGLVLVTGLVLYTVKEYKKILQIKQAMKQTDYVGEAKVAIEDWELTDTEGNIFTNKDLHGKWVIFYFGFTHCPDICPDELDKLAAVYDSMNMNSKLPSVQVVFVSIDPDRDTPPVVKEYLKEFSDKFIGLTGTMEQVKHAGRQYRVYFSKGKVDEDGDYIVDHSIVSYLVDPAGEFAEFFVRSTTALEITGKIQRRMREFKG